MKSAGSDDSDICAKDNILRRGKPRIVFLTRSLEYGGAEFQLITLAANLHKRGYPVTVVTFYPHGILENELIQAGVELKSLNKRDRWDVLAFMRRFILFLRERKPDILHGYLPIPNLLTVFIKPLFPKIKMVWGVRASNVAISHYDWFARFAFKIECILSRFADLIIANSHAGRDYHVQHGFPLQKFTVVPNGIDTHRFRPDAEARWRIRREWGIADKQPLIGIVGRFDPMKDHGTFFRAAAMLAEVRKDVRFVCVGDGETASRNRFSRLSNELGVDKRMVWAGMRNDMPSVYNALDVATSSSISEGFSNVIGEAMATEIFCVVTNVGDSACIVGDCGMVVPPGNPGALKIAWERALGQDRELIGKAARRRIVERFSVGRMIEATEAAIWAKA